MAPRKLPTLDGLHDRWKRSSRKGPHPLCHQADSRHMSHYRFHKLKSLVLKKIEMKCWGFFSFISHPNSIEKCLPEPPFCSWDLGCCKGAQPGVPASRKEGAQGVRDKLSACGWLNSILNFRVTVSGKILSVTQTTARRALANSRVTQMKHCRSPQSKELLLDFA